MSILSTIQAALKKVVTFFESAKAKQAIITAGALADEAIPVVQAIDEFLGGNVTLETVAGVYEKYGVAFVNATESTNLQNALLNLATQVLRAKLSPAQAGTATNIIQTAIQLAVTALHAA